MIMERVNSAAIRAVGHDPGSNVLRIEFTNGNTHEYFGVTADQHRELMESDSLGRHFGQKIRHVFTSRKL